MFKLSRRTAVAAATCLFALSGVVSAAELTGTLKKAQLLLATVKARCLSPISTLTANPLAMPSLSASA